MPSPRIPLIDLAAPQASVVHQLAEAAAAPGFFQVVNSGIDATMAGDILATARAFFACDTEAKRAVTRTRENPFGYYDRELTKNLRDRKEIFDFAPGEDTPWPAAMPALRPALESFAASCHALALRLTALLCEGLGQAPGSLLAQLAPEHSSFLRLNHYPVHDLLEGQAPAPGPLGISPHTDAGVLTVLLQDAVAGLQMQQGDAWVDVAPIPQALTINIGDMLQLAANDRYTAPLHRVRASDGQARLSIAYFLNPGYQAVIEPLQGLLSAAQPARYRALPWKEFRGLRALGDFGDYGEEVQISHYRIPPDAE
ncbi:MAG TPA: hypothetical protein DCP75_13385 [Haliea salexigens]|uniref:2-oxoglutarate-dependent ethylene/succinate-forming enzyme n=1 Tax=Haliea salexigens TaxID=287487 RepID=A0A3C1KPS1_9GAMM|nr:hypothetical protein [Haliea sp.]HAN28690.1 hypothetical protein [Haliea salexigens]HBX71675.1 hypothetical protein [Halieaceae bacterium]|tara:strand:- start:21387 stop:22322 length:936 start_codon:yes stop_codon:yes gene_type:complete